MFSVWSCTRCRLVNQCCDGEQRRSHEHDGPTIEIIFFTNPDYGPCRQMTKTVNHFEAGDLGLDVEQVDVWQNLDKVVDHEVMIVPTSIIQVDGEERARLNGLRSWRALQSQIDRIAGTEVISTCRTPLLSMSRRLVEFASVIV